MTVRSEANRLHCGESKFGFHSAFSLTAPRATLFYSMKSIWWKYLAAALLLYATVAGVLMPVPRRAILNETIRNLFFHVPMWFAMTVVLTVSVGYAIAHLRTGNLRHDVWANEGAKVATLFGFLGVLTGSLWARYTWGTWWTDDVRLNGAARALLIYGAYFVLRASLPDPQQRARIGAVYNIFAFAVVIPLLFVLPRMNDSLHPGAGGNPAFSKYDLDHLMRLVFYPAVIGWILVGAWLTQLGARLTFLSNRLDDQEDAR